MPIIAPWLKAPDLAGEYLRGLSIGQQAAEANQRLQAERERTAMEAQVREQTLQARALEEQQRIQVQKAYQTAQIGLREQQLKHAAAVNAQKTRAAAIKLHQQTVYGKVMQETNDPVKALFASGLATPQNVLAARKDVQDLGSQRLQQRQEALEFRERMAEEKAHKAPVPRRIGETVVTDPATGDKTTKYMFEPAPVPAAAGTGVAGTKGVKRLRFNAKTGALDPVEAAAASPEHTEDEDAEMVEQ